MRRSYFLPLAVVAGTLTSCTPARSTENPCDMYAYTRSRVTAMQDTTEMQTDSLIYLTILLQEGLQTADSLKSHGAKDAYALQLERNFSYVEDIAVLKQSGDSVQERTRRLLPVLDSLLTSCSPPYDPSPTSQLAAR